MKPILLLTLLSAFPFYALVLSAAPPKKQAEPVPEKKIEPKKKYNFIGKLLEKEKLEPEKKDDDKKDEDKKGKKGKKGGRAHLLKFQVKEVIDGKDALKPNLILICVAEPGQPRNPNQVKGGQAEPGEFYRVTSFKKLVKEDKVLRLADCRLFSAKGKVGEEYPVGKTWNGSLPVKSLELLPEEQRQSPVVYFGDNKSFTALLEAFKPFDKKAPLPQVDFSKSVVVLVKNLRHPEPIVGIKARLDEGALRVSPKKDFDGFIDGRKMKGQIFAAFFVLPRKGITTLTSGKKHEFEIKPPGFIYAD
jgi:hypothetical protein